MTKSPNRGRTLLAVGLLLGVAAVNYGIFRARPLLGDLNRLRDRAADLRAEADQWRLPVSTGPGRAEIEQELKAEEERLAQLRDRNAGWTGPSGLEPAASSRPAPCAPVEKAQEVAVMLSALAGETGLEIESRQPLGKHPAPAGEAGAWNPLPLAGNRPIQDWTVHCDFRSLKAFLEGLKDLPWRVCVLRLRIERVDPAPARDPGSPLRVAMWVSL